MRVLIIGYVFPEPASSAAGTRMMQLLEYFKTRSYDLTFATTAAFSSFATPTEPLGISSVKIELNNASFDTFLEELQPEIVIFDRFMMEEQFGWRVERICPEALRILDTEDLHCLRHFREKQFRNPALTEAAFTGSELAKREVASIYRCDLSLIISEVEMEVLQEVFQVPEALLCYLPFLFDKVTPERIAALPGFEDREDFITIGNFRHKPNVDAVGYLKDQIWPLIHKQLPQAKMKVYGAYAGQSVQGFDDPSTNFYIKGRVSDAAAEVQKARVSLAALRYGAGLKGKLAESMICGTPSVTTAIGAEGMCGTLPWNGAIENSPERFARAAIALNTDPELWQKAVTHGFDIIHSRFFKGLFYDRLDRRLSTLRHGLGKHRDTNFTGAMLRHHRSKSTYFLSRYIEIKNEFEQYKGA